MHYGSIMGPSMSEVAEPDDPRFMDYTRLFLAKSIGRVADGQRLHRA